MAKAAISQEEIQLRKRARRRLVGAAFLVLLMVIVLPMILDSEPRPQAESVRVQMPALAPPPPPPPVQSAPRTEAPASVATEETPSPLPVDQPVEPTLPAENTQSGAVDSGVSNASTEGELRPPVVIQLGAFSNPENAAQLKEALVLNKIKAYSEEVKTGVRSKTRVRAGPFDSVSEAEKARARIASMNLKLGMEPKIVADGQ